MLLITGATGRIGSAAAATIARNAKIPARLLVRDPKAELPADVSALQRVTGDLSDIDSLSHAMRDVSGALLVAPNGEQQFQLEKNFIDAAGAAGVSHIVKISSMEAGPTARAPIPKLHYQAEEYLRASGIPWTFLRPNFFLQNFLMYAQTIKSQQFFALPFADARIAPVDTADVGAVAAEILGASDHFEKIYTMTAASTCSLQDIADAFSRGCGKPIRYLDQDPAEFRALLLKIVSDSWLANAVADLFAEIRSGALAQTSTDIADILGREPATIDAFVDRYRPAFC